MSASLKLAEVCLERLYFQDDIDLIFLVIKLLFSSIQQYQNCAVDTDDKETKAHGKGSLKEHCIVQLSKKLGSKLKRELHQKMPDYYRSDALPKELQVRIV